MLLKSPARQRKSSPKEHRAKRRREPSRWPVVGSTPQDANCPNAKRQTNAKTSKQKDIFPYYHRCLQSTVHLPSEIKNPASSAGYWHLKCPGVVTFDRQSRRNGLTGFSQGHALGVTEA